MASDLHAIYCPLWAVFAVVLIESLRNWHDWYHRHPHFMRRPARRMPDAGVSRGTDRRRAGGGVGSCLPRTDAPGRVE